MIFYVGCALSIAYSLGPLISRYHNSTPPNVIITKAKPSL